MHRATRRAALAFIAVSIACGTRPVGAQDYPTRPITLVVPYPPGGGVDSMARVVADKLSAALGKQVVVDNRGGGSGLVGTRAVVRAAPDGYTLMLAHTGTIAINPSLFANPGFDPRKDFAPIGLVASMAMVLVAHPSLPAGNVQDVVALAKKEPGKLNLGSSPVGTGSYMSAELFKAVTASPITIVPYRGTAPLLNDLLGGHVPVAFAVIPPAYGNIQSGHLRPLAVTSPTRTGLLPNVPTFAESGLPEFEAVMRYGVVAPAGTPRSIVERLNKELRAALTSADVRERIAADGGDPLSSTPEEYAADIDREETKWSALVRRLGLKVE